MITLSDLNKAAQVKKAANAAMAQVTASVTNAGKKVLSVAEAAVEAVGGVMPVTHNALDNATHDILMVVAGVQQRVESIEEELQISTQIDEQASEVIVEGYMALMQARRNRKVEPAKVEAPVATPAPAVESAPIAENSVAKQIARAANAGTPRIRFDDIPKAQQ